MNSCLSVYCFISNLAAKLQKIIERRIPFYIYLLFILKREVIRQCPWHNRCNPAGDRCQGAETNGGGSQRSPSLPD